MQDLAGSIIEGRVTTVTGFGAFIQLQEHGAEGLLPLGQLPNDYYDVDLNTAEITGRSTGIKIRTGDVIGVMVVEVSPLKASVTLSYADGDYADGNYRHKSASSWSQKTGPRGGSHGHIPKAKKK